MKRFLFVVLILFFGWLVGREWWWKAPQLLDQVVTVEIQQGSSVATVADQLKDQQVIGSPFLFKLYAKLSGQSRNIQVGAFEFANELCASEVLDILTNVEASEVTLTFIEGWTLDQMGSYLEEKGILNSLEWVNATRTDLEGYLFPDTYRFVKGVSAEAIVERLREEMEEKITSEMRAEMDRRGISMHEMLTMASIIEREVHQEVDRKQVSDIFWKRLEIGMPLQADSTVSYVTKKKTPSISYEDREVDSPYNTYKYRGLPPGPIAAPSLSSIQATLYPTSNPYFFFLTDTEGNVHYAKTLEEHISNKARYLK